MRTVLSRRRLSSLRDVCFFRVRRKHARSSTNLWIISHSFYLRWIKSDRGDYPSTLSPLPLPEPAPRRPIVRNCASCGRSEACCLVVFPSCTIGLLTSVGYFSPLWILC